MKEVKTEDCRVERDEHAAAMLGMALMTGVEIRQLSEIKDVDRKLILTRVEMGKQAAKALQRQARDCKLSEKRREMLLGTVSKDRSYCARLLRAMRKGLGFFDAHDAAWLATHNAGGAK
jgi:hypothetical protein